MEKFTRLEQTAIPLDIENVDTDQIIPARFLKATDREGFGKNLFRDFRKICGHYATGITVLTTTHKGESHGITVNSFSSVSLDPPLVLFCIDKDARFNMPLREEQCLAINILSENQEEVSNRFANSKLTNEERFTGLATLPEHKYPVFADSLGVLEAELQATHDGGDHWIYVAKVSSGRVFDGSPLLYYGGSYSSVNPKA